MPPYDQININIVRIIGSIRPYHVTEYDWLVHNIHNVAEPEYQGRYRRYWRLNGKGLSQNYCQAYFQHLQAGLNHDINELGALTEQLYQIPIRPNRQALQFAFCTKLCHMLNRNLPIYDTNIRAFYRTPGNNLLPVQQRLQSFMTPGNNLPVQERIQRLIAYHQDLVSEYDQVLNNEILAMSIQLFRQHFDPQHFTDIKVIDSLIWAY